MSLYEFQFSPDLDIDDAPIPEKTLIIASTPRSGSHMLGHALLETGQMGVPFEYANKYNLPAWQRRFGTGGLADTLRHLMTCRTTSNGVFSVKLHYAHLGSLGGLKAALEIFPNPKVVLVYRADLLKQAISLAKARQTGVWIDGMQGNGDRARYSYRMIKRELEWLAVHNALWRVELAALGQDWTEVEFGEVLDDTEGTLGRIADFAGITIDPARLPPRPATTAQSDAAGRDETVLRYAADRRKMHALHRLPARIAARARRLGR